MGRSVLLRSGGALTLASLTLLIVGYAPAMFVPRQPALDVIDISPKCGGAVTIEMKLSFVEPHFWASSTATRMIVEDISKCKAFWISTTNRLATVKLLSSEAVFAGEKREIQRLLSPKPNDGPSKIYEFNTEGLSKHWFLVVEHAFPARRTGFDRYTAAGVLSLVIGDWHLEASSGPSYAVNGGGDARMSVISEERPEDRDLYVEVGATFSEITDYKDVFSILVSTVLGLALSTLIQGLASEARAANGSRSR